MIRRGFVGLLLVVLVGIVLPGISQAQTVLRIEGQPAVRLNPTWDAGFLASASDTDDTTEIHWDDAEQNTKISVSTFCPGQRFALTVEAKNPVNAVATGAVQLVDGMRDTDLLVHVKKKKPGKAQIVYLTEVLFEQGNTENGLSDLHAVTFTLSEQ